MYESILVPLDGSPTAERALRPAASIARRSGARLHLARVPLVQWGGSLDVEYGKTDSSYMTGMAARLRDSGVESVSAAVLDPGDVAAELEKHRVEIGAQLTVMSSHGRGPVERAWLGSVTDRFVRHTEAPVLVVRARSGESETDELASDVHFHRLLVPLDGSRLSEAALAPAMELAGNGESVYILLRVIEAPHALGAPWLPSAPTVTEDEIRHAPREPASELERLAKSFGDRGLTAESVTEVAQPVARGILDAAHKHGADLIVMATHGRGGLKRAWMGSVTDKVVRGTDHPVLIVRPRVA
jgi:nucleotide-binding universal stress UspA family protein